MTFYAVEINGVTPAFGWQGGPGGRTRIKALRNQHENRNIEADLARHRYILPFQNIKSLDYLLYLKNAHMAMYAMAHSFLVKDWLDFQAQLESLGAAPSGSSAVQLVKNYAFGPASRARPITKPLAAGFNLYQNGTPKAGTLDTLTGLFTPTTPWTGGADLTWSGEFRVPVRFNNDEMPMAINNKSGGQHVVGGSVELIEVFGE